MWRRINAEIEGFYDASGNDTGQRRVRIKYTSMILRPVTWKDSYALQKRR